MKRKAYGVNEERGVGMVNAMLALSLLAIFALVASSIAINEKRSATSDVVQTNAFLSADSGGEEAIAWLRAQKHAPAVLKPASDNHVVHHSGERRMELNGSAQRFEYSIRARSQAADGLPGRRPRAGYQMGEQGGYEDLFYVVDARGEADGAGESRVDLLVSKLYPSGYAEAFPSGLQPSEFSRDRPASERRIFSGSDDVARRTQEARDRDGWKLDDSTPVLVGPPRSFLLTADHQRFLSRHADRRPVLYATATDGLLHAFAAEDGRELWAFAPRTNLSESGPAAFDAKIDGEWRSVLVGGTTDGYFALDVSEPDEPLFLWERSFPRLGRHATRPALVRTREYTALWAGSAPDADGLAAVHLIDLADGSLLGEPLVLDRSGGENGLSAATAIDLDSDGYHELVYQSSLAGIVYRFQRETDGEDWQAWPIFDSGGQPIQARPSVAYFGPQRLLIAFGSGRRASDDGARQDDPRNFYGLIDDLTLDGVTRRASDLRDQSYGVHDASQAAGWHFRLRNDDEERVTEAAAIVEGVVYFSSYAPADDQHAPGGRSWIYGVDYRSGAAIVGDSKQRATDRSLRSEAIGEGIASRPMVLLGDDEFVIRTSEAKLTRHPLLRSPTTLMVRSWRESSGADTTVRLQKVQARR